MSSTPDTVSLIQSAFPGRHELVERAYRCNGTFHDLCDDYRKCLRALERWEQREASEGGRRRQEYTELLGELRGEIRSWLEAMETGSNRTNGRLW